MNIYNKRFYARKVSNNFITQQPLFSPNCVDDSRSSGSFNGTYDLYNLRIK